MGKSNPESFDYFPPSVFFFSSLHLACVSTRIPGWAETKGISIIPVYPCTVFFNISGMSAFIFSVLCYSKNARFAISSQGWAPGKSGMSKGSPRQHPTPSEPNLHLSLESGHRSRLTKHAPIPEKTPQITISSTRCNIFFLSSFNLANLKTYNHVRDSRQRPAVAQK